jgi:hypothetical protein
MSEYNKIIARLEELNNMYKNATKNGAEVNYIMTEILVLEEYLANTISRGRR